MSGTKKERIPLIGLPGMTREGKLAMISQFLGFGMDAYDMGLVIILAPVLTHVFVPPSKAGLAWQYVMILLTYSITMAARPFGSAFFGHYADKFGRRRIFLITMAGVGIVTGVTAFLPTYAEIGIWAWVLFALMRFLMGFIFGGEYAVGHTFTMELCPKDIRGRVGGIIQSGFPFGYMLNAFVFAAFSAVMSEEAMIAVGWRYVFLTGLIPVFIALVIRRMLPESPMYKLAKERGELEKHPFLSLFKPPALWTFLIILVFMSGLFIRDYTVYSYIPDILTLKGHGFDYTTYSLIYGFSLFITVLGYIFYGWLSDYTGRRKLTILWNIYILIIGIPAYYLLYIAALSHIIGLALLATIIVCSLKFTWGMLPAWLAENFPTKRRSSGVGFGYSGGVFVGAWYSIYTWWVHSIPQIQAIEGEVQWLSPAIVGIIGAVMCIIAILFVPERKGIDLAEIKE
jgi:MFS family permease